MLRYAAKTLATAIMVFAAGAAVNGAQARDLKMSLWYGQSHFLTPEVMMPFIADVERLSDGDLTITLYPDSVLGKISDQLTLVENGIADMAMIVPSYTPGRFPLTESGGLPFAFDSATHGGKVYEELMPYVEEEFDTVKLLFMTVNTSAALLTVNTPVATVEDIRGQRISGSAAAQQQFLTSLGAVADFMPISEKYVALERGTIEGVMMPLASATGYKMEEVTKYVTRLNYSSTPLVMIMNRGTWDSLDPDQQAALTQASEVAQKRLGPAYDAADEKGLQALLAADGELVEFPSSERDKLREKAAPFWDSYQETLRKRTPNADEFIAALRASIEETR